MKRFIIFSPDSLRWILGSLLLTIITLFQFGILLALPLILISLFLILFFIDPDRELPSHPLGVMSPIDGHIEKIELFYDPFLDRTSRRIRIRSSLFRVYQARSPTEGKLMEYWPVLSEDKPGYDKHYVKGVWWIQTDEGDDVIMIVESRFIFGRTYCTVQAGERIGQARRCGRFPMFCRVDLLVDEKSFTEVELGQRVLAGVHTIATFNHDVAEAGQA